MFILKRGENDKDDTVLLATDLANYSGWYRDAAAEQFVMATASEKIAMTFGEAEHFAGELIQAGFGRGAYSIDEQTETDGEVIDPSYDEDEDDDWDNEDDLDKAYRRDMIEHRLHENATAAMREMIVKAGLCSQEGRILGKDTLRRRIKEIARASYQMAHAMQQAFEQTQGGFTEAPASSETEAAVAHRETDVFVVMTKLGPFPIGREWLEKKKALYPTLDVYHEVRQACDKLNERGELSRIANGPRTLNYLERCLMAMAQF
jgi:hypothetical protein